MRTLHKLTHRPLAQRLLTLALFVGLGVLGWQLPQLGSAVMAYSSKAVKAVRATLTSPVSAQPASPSAKAATTAGAPKVAGQQDTKAAVEEAAAALAAAKAALRANHTKANGQAVDVAEQNYNAAVAARVADIKNQLNGASQNSNPNGTQDAPNQNSGPANYADLVAELSSYGAFYPNVIQAAAPNVTPETEPNSTAVTAQTLNLAAQNVTIVGGSITAGDQDWFKVTVAANSKIWAFVDTGGTQNAGATSRDSQLTVFQSNGTTQVEFDDDDGSGRGGDTTQETGLASAIAGASLTAAGDYLIKINAFSASGVIDPYRLYIVVTTTAGTAEAEPNDDAATATSIVTNADTVGVRTGAIGAAGDLDFYSVQATAGNIIFFSVDADPARAAGAGLDLEVQLRDTNGTTILYTVDSGFANDTENAESTSFVVPATGTYYLVVKGFGSETGNYAIMAAAANSDGGAPQVCPPSPITSNLGVAGGNFPKTSGSMTQRLFRDGVVSACGVPRTQAAPIAATRTYDKYSIVNTGGAPTCIFISLTVNETTASNYMVAAYSPAFNPANITQGWLGDPGLSSGIPPSVQSFSVNVPAGANVDVIVFNANATGDGNSYSLTVLGFPTCPPPPPCTITCPANITVNAAAGTCAATVNYSLPTTSGVCASGVQCTPPPGTSFQKGTTTVNCTGASLGGQPAGTCSFTVTVVDNQPPTITKPADIFVGTTGASAQVTFADPTVADNCPGVGAPTCNPPSGSLFPVGVTTVNCSVTDAVGLTATTSFTVTVNRLAAGSISDPLACTGPGNVLSGFFTVTNTGNVSQTLAASATTANPPNNLLFLPGTCTVSPASAGTCTVVNGNTLTVSGGSLTAGQTATVSYKLQVNDGAPAGTPVCTNVSASFNGGAAATASACITPNCPLAGPGAPFITQNGERLVTSDQRPGSVLIYPIYTSDASGGSSQNARISLTNTSSVLESYVHLFFVDGSTCSVSDAFVCLTPNQTSSFLTSDLDPGTTGYIVAVASDKNGCPQHFNYLIGDAYVKFSSGHQANLGAEAIPAIAGSGFFTSCDGTQPTATLRFNGADYGWVPYTIAADSIPSTADGNNTLLIIDRIGGDLQTGPARLGPIFGVLYDDAEIAYSFNLPTNNLCQFRGTLSDSLPRTTPRLSQVVPAGRTGWMKFSGISEFGLIGVTINYNANSASSSGAFNGGHNLHKLTFTNTMTYTIPVFPPTC